MRHLLILLFIISCGSQSPPVETPSEATRSSEEMQATKLETPSRVAEKAPPTQAAPQQTVTSGDAQTTPPRRASSVVVPKHIWVAAYRNALPAALCQPGQYFIECIKYSSTTCEKEIAKATDTCLAEYEERLPDEFHQPEDGTKWGSAVGACAGTRAETANTKISTPKCDNPQNWY